MVKVLFVTHDFLPRHKAGVEIHAFQTAKGLKERGLDVRVFTTEKVLSLGDGTVFEETLEGIPLIRLVRNRMFRSFRETWHYPPAEKAFLRVLESFQPELVHFHHLLYLSLSLPRAARAAGAETLFTLHDFWLQCRLMGQRLDPWGRVCSLPGPAHCAPCLLARPPEGAGPAKRAGAAFLRGIRSLAGLDLAPLARRWALRFARKARPLPPRESFAAGDLEEAARQLEERRKAVLEDVVPQVGLFLSPSRFLLEEMAAFGIPRGKIRLFRLGVDPLEVSRSPRRGRVRFAYFGTVAPHKGVHVLLEAFRGLSGKAELVVHGGAPYHPEYAREVKRLCRESGARWTGAYSPGELPGLLAGCDCVVVPSLWFENSPLTILQARAAGIPSVVSGIGGMAELVEEGGGWTFPPGDAGALREILAGLAEQPGRLEEEGAKGSPPPTVARNVQALLDLYRSLAAGPGGKEKT